MDKFRILILSAIIFYSCESKPQAKVTSSVWEPVTGYEKKEFDSTLILAFEENFDDKIQIYRGDTHIKELNIKTNRSIGAVPYFEKIENISSDKKESLKILFLNKDENIEIELWNNYRYAYVSRFENGDYHIEYSNYQREYY